MTSMRRRYVASTSLGRHVSAGNLPPPWPPSILNPAPPPRPPPPPPPPPPPNILNLPTPMQSLVRKENGYFNFRILRYHDLLGVEWFTQNVKVPSGMLWSTLIMYVSDTLYVRNICKLLFTPSLSINVTVI